MNECDQFNFFSVETCMHMMSVINSI